MREAAVSLLGRHAAGNQALALRLFSTLARAATDPGTSVRKSAIKILWECCISAPGFPRATGAPPRRPRLGSSRRAARVPSAGSMRVPAPVLQGCRPACLLTRSCGSDCVPCPRPRAADACKHVLMRAADPEESIQDMVARVFHRWRGSGGRGSHGLAVLLWAEGCGPSRSGCCAPPG